MKNWVKSFILAGIFTILIAQWINPYSWDLALVALLSLIFVLTPIFMFYYTRNLMHICMFIPLFMTWLYFLAPFLYEELITHEYRSIPLEYLPHMAIFSALSTLSLFIGYYLTFRTTEKRPISPLTTRFSNQFLGKIVLFFIASGLISRLIDYYVPWVKSPFYQLLQVMDFSPVLALSMGLLYFLRKGRSPVVLIPLLTFLIFEILLRTSETLFSKIIYLVASLFLIFIIERRRIPWVTIVLIFLLSFPVFNARTQFRSEAVDRWYYKSFEEKEKIPELLGIGLRYIKESYNIWNWTEFGESAKTQASTRFEDISYLGQCVWLVEECDKPLKYGETFWWLPLSVVPRAIFPQKPINYHPTLLADEYGVRNPLSNCAMNFPMLVEMYINFGFSGMVVLSFFQGMLYKWCLRKAAFGVGDLNMLLFINMLWHLEKVESNITMIFGGLFQVLLIWWAITKFLKLREPKDSIKKPGWA